MKTKVYFNNSCSICRTEINQYKKHSGNNIEWVDISSCSDASKDTKKNIDSLYRRMHVLENGELVSGAKSFLIIWGKFLDIIFYVKYLKNHLYFRSLI